MGVIDHGLAGANIAVVICGASPDVNRARARRRQDRRRRTGYGYTVALPSCMIQRYKWQPDACKAGPGLKLGHAEGFQGRLIACKVGGKQSRASLGKVNIPGADFEVVA